MVCLLKPLFDLNMPHLVTQSLCLRCRPTLHQPGATPSLLVPVPFTRLLEILMNIFSHVGVWSSAGVSSPSFPLEELPKKALDPSTTSSLRCHIIVLRCSSLLV